MNRRSFLAGIATTLLAGTAVARAAPMVLRTWIPAGEVYGRSPMRDALPAQVSWRELIERLQASQLGKQQMVQAEISSLLQRTW